MTYQNLLIFKTSPEVSDTRLEITRKSFSEFIQRKDKDEISLIAAASNTFRNDIDSNSCSLLLKTFYPNEAGQVDFKNELICH